MDTGCPMLVAERVMNPVIDTPGQCRWLLFLSSFQFPRSMHSMRRGIGFNFLFVLQEHSRRPPELLVGLRERRWFAITRKDLTGKNVRSMIRRALDDDPRLEVDRAFDQGNVQHKHGVSKLVNFAGGFCDMGGNVQAMHYTLLIAVYIGGNNQ